MAKGTAANHGNDCAVKAVANFVHLEAFDEKVTGELTDISDAGARDDEAVVGEL